MRHLIHVLQAKAWSFLFLGHINKMGFLQWNKWNNFVCRHISLYFCLYTRVINIGEMQQLHQLHAESHFYFMKNKSQSIFSWEKVKNILFQLYGWQWSSNMYCALMNKTYMNDVISSLGNLRLKILCYIKGRVWDSGKTVWTYWIFTATQTIKIILSN